MAVAWFDEQAGLRSWWQLRTDLAAAEERMEALRARIGERRAETSGLRSDEFGIETAIRQDLGWARPGEIVVRLPEEAPSLRNP